MAPQTRTWIRAVLLSCCILACTYLLTGCSPKVPELRGVGLGTAKQKLQASGLKLGQVAYDPASTSAKGTVVRQSQADRAEKGTRVALVLAGPKPVQVPVLIGLPQQEALMAIGDSQLIASDCTSEYDAHVASSTVISQNPESSMTVGAGTQVTVVISRGPKPRPSDVLRLKQKKVLNGPYSPKSVVATQRGQVFAQNMIYRHTVTVFDDSTYEVVKTIKDTVVPADFGYSEHQSAVRGGPVEAAVSADGSAMYVSQYSMYGPGYSHPGDDAGGPGSGVDNSFVYRIPLDTLKIDQLIKVGAVPKYVATTPDGRYVLVSNWISYSLSVIDAKRGKQVKEIRLGRFPRGIAVDPDSRHAYVAVMGSSDIAKVNLDSFEVEWLRGVGSSPRHLIMSPEGRWLYVTFNGAGTVAKINLKTNRVVDRVRTGSQPRSMAMAGDGKSLYVVNYESNTVSKVRTKDMKVLQSLPTAVHPIGVTYVEARRELWVSCYRGSIMVFKDR